MSTRRAEVHLATAHTHTYTHVRTHAHVTLFSPFFLGFTISRTAASRWSRAGCLMSCAEFLRKHELTSLVGRTLGCPGVLVVEQKSRKKAGKIILVTYHQARRGAHGKLVRPVSSTRSRGVRNGKDIASGRDGGYWKWSMPVALPGGSWACFNPFPFFPPCPFFCVGY